MANTSNKLIGQPTAGNAWKWFDPRYRSISTWGFILNRITALGLTLYLFMHLMVLGQLAFGSQGYENFLNLLHNPIFVFAEWLVVAAGLIHGLNGVRIALNSFGIAVPQQRVLLVALMGIAGLGSLFFALKMFGLA